MPRVTENEVTAIVDTERHVTPFIDVASLIVDENLSGKGLTAARLIQIELYLAAHFTAVTEEHGSLVSSEGGDAKDTYFTRELGKGLAMTRYGQQALALDTSGTLSGINSLSGSLSAQFRLI